MFVKITKARQHKYVQIVNSFREGDKVKHKVLYNLGRLDELETMPSFKQVVMRLAEIVGLPTQNSNSSFSNICSAARIVNWGYLVYKKIWNKFKIEHILAMIQSQYKITYSLNDACFLMVINHLLSPQSKLSGYLHQQNYVQLPNVKLNYFYRALDVIAEHKSDIEKQLFKRYSSLTKKQIDVVFYDVTTFHFESVKADSLRNFGYSKNCKFNEVQVVLGLLVDQNGLPIGYELFSGNTFDGKTLEQSLQKINKIFKIRNVVIVADRGINSKFNLASIKAQGYGYIVAARIKSMSVDTKKLILTKEQYQYRNDREEGFRFKILDHTNNCELDKKTVTLQEKLIITYSPKRAKKDQADRERLINKANLLLKSPEKIKSSEKRGGKKYIAKETEANDRWFLDEEKIANDQIYDGYYAIQTSETNFSVDQILNAYHSLWKIEESFRIMKTTLEVRPIFHWTEKRIEGHFVIAFLAFLLERSMECQLKQAEIKASPIDIRVAINSMQFSEIAVEDAKFYINTETTELGVAILKTFGIKPFKNCIPTVKFNSKAI